MKNKIIDEKEVGTNIQRVLAASYFRLHSNKNASEDEAVEWINEKWVEAFKVVFSDPFGDGKTVYAKKFNDNEQADKDSIADNLSTSRFFTENQKSLIVHRDKHKCVVCGTGLKENADKLHVDHVLPWNRGGKTTLENGQTLCSPHFMLKKLYIHFYAQAKVLGDEILECYFEDMLVTYDKDYLIGQSNWEEKKVECDRISFRNSPQYATA